MTSGRDGYAVNLELPLRFWIARPASEVQSIATAIAQPGAPLLSDAEGDFEFHGVARGTHRLVARADDFRSHELTPVAVGPDQTLQLGPQRLQLAHVPAKRAPCLVRDRTTRENPFDRSETHAGPRGPGDHLDLVRTKNAAIPFNMYNRDQIARSGVVNLNEFLHRKVLDSDAATRPPEQDGDIHAFQAGGTNVNLRGFVANQTFIARKVAAARSAPRPAPAAASND